MAQKRKSKTKKVKKVNWVTVIFVSLILSYALLSYMDIELGWGIFPSLDEITETVTGKNAPEVIEPCEVHFIDVEQGDSALIISDGKTILIDCGEYEESTRVVSYLNSLGIKKIDYLVLSHLHSDHMGGMSRIIKNFDIGRIITKRVADELVPTSRSYTEFLYAVAEKGLKLTEPKLGDAYDLGAGRMTFLGPAGEFDNLNDTSLVVKFNYKTQTFLFTGDMESSAEKALLNTRADPASTVLKVAHHGSNTSTTKGFYKAVNPKYCVISVGEDNSYHHPHKKTLDTIAANGATVYRTDINGNIVFGVNADNELNVRLEREG